MQNMHDLLSIGESADYLGISIDTLRRWDNKGIIIAYRSPSGHRYFDKNDLNKLFGKKYIRVSPIKNTEANEKKPIPFEPPTQKDKQLPKDEKIQPAFTSHGDIEPPPPQQMIKILNINEVPKPQNSQLATSNILTPPNQSTKQFREAKKEISWTTIIIIGLVLFTVIDIVLLIIFLTGSQQLASPVP